MGEVLKFPDTIYARARRHHNQREEILLSWLRTEMEGGVHWEMALDVVWSELRYWYDGHYNDPDEEMEPLSSALDGPLETVALECACGCRDEQQED